MIGSTKKSLFAVAVAVIAFTGNAQAGQQIVPPDVPPQLEVEEGHVPFLVVHATGTQNQVCLPRANGVGLGWTFYGPIATLFNEQDEQVLTHYLSPNPDEAGTARAAWQHARDASTIWAMAVESATSVTDPDYVAAGAIPWLKLRVVGRQAGPDGGDKMVKTTYIQRVHTVGGVAPATDCAPLGAKLFVPYETDYVFYRER